MSSCCSGCNARRPRDRRNCASPVTIHRGPTQVAVDKTTSVGVGDQLDGTELVRVRAHDDGAWLRRSRRALQGIGLHLFLCDGLVDLRGPGGCAVRARRAPGRGASPDRCAAEPVRALFELRAAGGRGVRSAVAADVREIARGVPDPDRARLRGERLAGLEAHAGARAIWRPGRHPCRRLAGVLHADSLCAVERSESSSSIARPGRARSRPPLPGGRRHRADGVQAAARSGHWAGDDPGGRVARRGGRGPRRVSGARGCLAGERFDRDAAVCQRAGDARARSVAGADLSRGSSFAAWLCPPADWLACRSLSRLDRRGRSGGLDRRADLEERRAPDDEVGQCWWC